EPLRGQVAYVFEVKFGLRFLNFVALAIASGRIELPVQSSTYPSDVIDTMLAMLQIDSDRRPSIQDVIDKLSTSSRFTMDII
ncbi:unnamed protein product, partial [Rotaria magnacalcarata]